MLANLSWKLNRLRAMGAPEVAHRVRDAVQQRLQARGIGLVPVPPPASLARFGQPWLGLPSDPAPHLAAAERILAGRFDVFALRDVELGFPPEWNRDPKTGTLAPVTFGKTLNYRDEAVVGDIKCLWEPNRHLMLGDLAMAAGTVCGPSNSRYTTSWPRRFRAGTTRRLVASIGRTVSPVPCEMKTAGCPFCGQGGTNPGENATTLRKRSLSGLVL